MKVIYDLGIKGDLEACKYFVDRFKGKPTAILGIARVDADVVNAESVLAFRKLIDADKKLLEEGTDAIQGQGEAQASEQGLDEEEA